AGLRGRGVTARYPRPQEEQTSQGEPPGLRRGLMASVAHPATRAGMGSELGRDMRSGLVNKTAAAKTHQIPALIHPRISASVPVNIGEMYSPETAWLVACMIIARRTLPPVLTTIHAKTTAPAMIRTTSPIGMSPVKNSGMCQKTMTSPTMRPEVKIDRYRISLERANPRNPGSSHGPNSGTTRAKRKNGMISVHNPIWALVGLGAPSAMVASAERTAAPE